MGKKRGLGAGNSTSDGPERTCRYWCYYCGAEAKDEMSLIRHQISKHFRCPLCEPRSSGGHCQALGGLFSHIRRSHNRELDKIPGAVAGREDPSVEVYGMTGIPKEFADGPEEPVEPPPPPPEPQIVEPPPKEESKGPVRIGPPLLASPARLAPPLLSLGSTTQAKLSGLLGPPLGGSLILGRSFFPGASQATSAGQLFNLAAASLSAPLLPGAQFSADGILGPGLLPQVCGRWRHSSGGDIVISLGNSADVIIHHYMLGEQRLSLFDFVVAGRLRFCRHDGTLSGNTITWTNGSVWTKIE
mmetsp:Transcript_77128/g.195811  ORF Transcript_77128/g.195811 Transcript_77128/m.195811 type:complete len:301 (-) Transcript_77128:102-1004(-)